MTQKRKGKIKLKKRLLSILLTAVLLLSAVPLGLVVDTAYAASGSCGDKLTWSLSDDGTLTISGKGAMDNYKFDGYDYLANSYYYTDAPWDAYRYHIKSVVIKDGVTSIGDRAFYGCVNLSSVTIPSSVTSIGEYAFYDCRLASVTIPSSVTSIGSNAFEECEYLTSVTIPYGVAEIGERTFYNCQALTGVTIPGSVTSIGEYAFYDCYELPSVTIPRGVTSIAAGTFRNCRGLASVTIPDSVTSIGTSAFYNCGALTSVVIPDSVTSIGSSAFSGCGLTSVVIPNSVTSIDSGAFSDCDALTSVTISANLTSIEDYVFNYCKSLKSVTIPRGVTAIGERAFYQCEALVSVTIPDTVTEIGSEAFSGCTSLRSAKIPKGVTKIAQSTFSRCDKLASVTIPDTVTSIEGGAFYECSVLPSVTIPSSVTSIGSSAFDSCGRLKNVTIPSSVTSIGEEAFSYCSSLTSATISNGVTSIGSYAFYNCKALTSVTIPGSAASIGQSAFEGCEKLTSATILNGVTAIGERMFYDCNALASVTIPGSVTSIGSSAFESCWQLTSVTIPNSVESIGGGAFSSCGSLTSVTIPDSVVSIGGYAFSGCKALSSITIPGSVTSVGQYAFNACTSLENAAISGGVTNIAEGVFKGCAALTSVTISKSVTSIDADAFYECSSLTDVYYDGTAADWEIIAIDYGNENLTDAARHYVTLKPAAPTVKIGNSASSGKPQLTWRAVYGATSYRIYRSTAKGSGYSLLGTTTATSYTNTGAKAGTTYYYRVKACDDAGLSPYSNIVSGQVKTVTPKPSAPVVKIGHSAASGKPMLTWNAVSGATSYKVYRATSQNGTYSLLGTTTATSYTNTGAKAGTTYYYRVKACNDAGLSPYSNIVSGQVKTVTPKPAAPVVKIGNSASSGKPMLTWNAVSGATSYKVYRATSQNGTYSLLGTVTATSYINTGAKAGVTYYYKVKAVNSGGESAYSNVVSGKTTVTTLTMGHSATSGKPQLTWKAVSGAASYKVYRATTKNGAYSVINTTKALTYTNVGAALGTTYYYKVEALNAAGKSMGFSAIVEGKVAPVLAVGYSSVSGKPQLTWKAVPGATEYQVYRSTQQNSGYTKINTTTATSYVNTGAKAGTTYYYRIVAVKGTAVSDFSNIVSARPSK